MVMLYEEIHFVFLLFQVLCAEVKSDHVKLASFRPVYDLNAVLMITLSGSSRSAWLPFWFSGSLAWLSFATTNLSMIYFFQELRSSCTRIHQESTPTESPRIRQSLAGSSRVTLGLVSSKGRLAFHECKLPSIVGLPGMSELAATTNTLPQ
jgi:hypothetical protein